MSLIRYSYSSLGTFLECPKKFYYKYVLGYVPLGEAENLAYGSAAHTVLENWHGKGELVLPEIVNFRNASLAAVLKAYTVHYGPEIFETERKVELEIAGVPMVVKIDGLRNGNVFEHKTASQIGDYYWNGKSVDAQPCIYILAARKAGIEIDGVTYNVIRKPAKAKNGETPVEYHARIVEDINKRPDFYFERRSFFRTDKELDFTERDLRDTYELCEKGPYPRNTSACFDFGSTCEYHPVCFGGELIEESRLYRKKTKHVSE